jgi:competence protein ComEC
VPDDRRRERWQLVVRLKRPHGTVNPHGFDIEAWLSGKRASRNRICAQRRAQPARGRIRRPRRRISCSARAKLIRARILAALPDAPYAGVIVA